MAAKKRHPKTQNQQEPKQTQEKEEKGEEEEEEEEEPLQALRLKAIAEQKYASGNLTSALNYAKRAHNIRPNLAGVSEMLTAYNILDTARQAPVDNYYRILQVERFSHINSIKKQYKKLALILHPDKNPFAASEEAFKLVGVAFRVLSDKVRRKEYDMKIRISMQAEAAVGLAEEEKGVETFWTACSTCRLLHKFERKYLGHILVCPSCKKSFKAVEVSENGKEGEEDVVMGQMMRSAWVRGRRGGKLVGSGKGLLKLKRKVDTLGEASERSKGKKVKIVGGNEHKSEGLRLKAAGKGNNEGAGGDAESSGVIERSRLRNGRKVIAREEVARRKRTKRVNVGEDEMMTLAEMQTIAKRKLSEVKVKGKEKEKEEVKAKVTVKEKEEGEEEESRKEKEEESVKENGKVQEDGEKEKEKEKEESVKEKEKVQEDEREKEKEIEEGVTEEEMDMLKMEKRERLVVLENEHLGVVERRVSETSNIDKDKEMEKEIEKEGGEDWEEEKEKGESEKEIESGTEERENDKEREKESEEGRENEKEKQSGTEERENDKEREKESEEGKENEKEKQSGLDERKREKEKEMAVEQLREKRERRKTWKFESFWVVKRREEKEKEKEKEIEETELSMVKVKQKRNRRKTSKIESLKVVKRMGEEEEKENGMDEEMQKETDTSMVKVKEKRDRQKISKNESLEIFKRRALRSENMEIEKLKGSDQSSLEIVAVKDSYFYDFNKDRVGRNLKKGQVWALYDDNDGMPRHYALIEEVVSVNPFEARLNLLEFQSNGDEALISWEKLGFRISCGRFKVSTSFVVKSLKIFSHIANCERAARELYRIYPKKGSVWAIYNENALDAEERNMTVKNKSYYDIVVFLTSYSEIHGLSMAYLEKVDGFRTVFQRKEIGAQAIRWLEKEDYRLFSHQIPARKLSGEEAAGLSKDCWELDPASIPPEMLAIGWERENLPVPLLIENVVN